MKATVCHLAEVRDVCQMPVLAGPPLEFASSSFDLGTALFYLLLSSNLYPTLLSALPSIRALEKDSILGPLCQVSVCSVFPSIDYKYLDISFYYVGNLLVKFSLFEHHDTVAESGVLPLWRGPYDNLH